jgi:hypothetical protein
MTISVRVILQAIAVAVLLTLAPVAGQEWRDRPVLQLKERVSSV